VDFAIYFQRSEFLKKNPTYVADRPVRVYTKKPDCLVQLTFTSGTVRLIDADSHISQESRAKRKELDDKHQARKAKLREKGSQHIAETVEKEQTALQRFWTADKAA